ncbi:MAG TPA: putative toxin-antitoxin system toxin component, PIN family [Xanthomonadales bacterium]|nr:putative toxin-antitoxin system toxin component, PIN family [Xanthomonadales bacterium]
MSSATVANRTKIVLDTNIIISAIGFGGKPRQILLLVLDNKVKGVTSNILLAELDEVINKKFPALEPDLERITKKIKKRFIFVHPTETMNIQKDKDDNRVLEAAVEGKCNYIITGDKELLELAAYQKIKILTSGEFLKILKD